MLHFLPNLSWTDFSNGPFYSTRFSFNILQKLRIIVGMGYIAQFLSSIPQFFSTFNFLDLVILLVVLFYIREGYTLGFTLAFLDLVSFIIAFIAALKFYSILANFFIIFFGMPLGVANALGFFLV